MNKEEKRRKRLIRLAIIIATVGGAISIIFGLITLLNNTAEYISGAKKEAARTEYYEEPAGAALYDGGYLSYESDEYAIEPEEAWYEENSSNTADTGSMPVENGAKIIQTAYVSVQTREFEKSVKSIETLVSDAGGYVQYQNVDNKSSGYRTAYYTVRIPSEKLDTFINNTAETCTITSLTRNAEDVSSVYYDTDARLSTAKIKLERLQVLLGEAKKMEDIITIEESISDVEWEIDTLTGTLRNWDSLVNYATVEITIGEVYEVIDDDPAPLTFGERLSKAFQSGMTGTRDFFANILIGLASIWPVIIIVVIAVIVLIVVLKIRKKQNEEPEQQDQEEK